jgi:hypothetical protein
VPPPELFSDTPASNRLFVPRTWQTMPVICVVLLAAICASSGCRKSTAVAAPSSVGGTSGIGNVADLTTAPGTVFQVTYTDNTVVIDAATTEKTFRGVSADGQLFVFDNSNEQIKKLAPGSVMLLQGLALKKVVAVEARRRRPSVWSITATISRVT